MLMLSLGTTVLLGATLTIEVSNVTSHEAKVYVGLYMKNQNFPDLDDSSVKKIVEVKSDRVEVIFDELAEGSYAVAVFHDINNNGVLDKNFIGFPKEPFAFSNNFKPTFSKPKFEDCSFVLEKEGTKIFVALVD